jgi:hypothetical protein
VHEFQAQASLSDVITDPVKRRYFKIEGSHTAPAGTSWSSDNVKKRKLEDAKAAEVLRRLNLNKARIKRSQALNDPLSGGFLARESGAIQKDMIPAILAAGMVDRGGISFSDARWGPSQINTMCIVGEEPWTDLGFGYFCGCFHVSKKLWAMN